MNFTPIQFPNESIEYIAPTWIDLNQLAFEISKMMLGDELKFDRIVTLAKGGWPMTRSLVDFLKVKEVASIGVKFYSGINTILEKPQIYQDLPVSVAGESVLLFDDVADTGASMVFVKAHLEQLGIKKIVTASLFYKPHSIFKPDYYAAETSAWILFPYDLVESIQVLGGKWRKQGLNVTEILHRFEQLGFDRDKVEYFLKVS